MTPQQRRKAPIPHTDVAPRTRISAPVLSSADHPERPVEAASEPAQASARVPGTVALSTPRGPGSLRKSLLLKSARKIWKDTQSPGLEGAIENGSVQTRRKSLSPRVGTPSKIGPAPASSSESSEEEFDEEFDQVMGQEMADAFYHDAMKEMEEEELAEGVEDMSVDEQEDSESLGADISLEIVSSVHRARVNVSLIHLSRIQRRPRSAWSMNQCNKVLRHTKRKTDDPSRATKKCPSRMIGKTSMKSSKRMMTWKKRRPARLRMTSTTQRYPELQQQ
jgi:hypothetical protein